MKRHYLQSLNEVKASSVKVWETISRGNGVEDWHPLVSASYLNGNKRVCKTEQGDLNEVILTSDAVTQTYRYEIYGQNVYPAPNDIICTIKVVEGKSTTLLFWDIEFDLEEDTELAEISDGFQTLISAMASNLEKVCS